jgi:hypothetical protein
MEIDFAKFNQVKRYGELIFMNFKNDVDKSAIVAVKRAAFTVVVALALALPLQSQQSEQESLIDPTTMALDGGPGSYLLRVE